MKYTIIGAGVTGLTTGLLLAQKNQKIEIFEEDNQVGGIAKTVRYKKYRFDIGGHRFFTKNAWILKFWQKTLGKDFLLVERKSRIYFGGKFYNYPLDPKNALVNLGLFNSFLALFSYLKVRIRPIKVEKTLEDVYINSFGRFLYQKFFKVYSTRLWGISPSGMEPDWGKARVGKLSLFNAIKDAFFPNKTCVKSLIRKFYYPRLGPSQLWEKMAKIIRLKQGKIYLRKEIKRIYWRKNKIIKLMVGGRNKDEIVNIDQMISTMPLNDLISALTPRPPEKIIKAANHIKYRDYILVALIINKKNIFPDQWIYVQDPGFKVLRIQNFNNWSQTLVGDQSKTVLGMEYIVSQETAFWQKKDNELIKLAILEIERLNFVDNKEVIDAKVVRKKDVYPIYDLGYKKHLEIIKKYLIDGFTNLTLIGRTGMYKYNNMDHSMLTAKLAVENFFGAKNDLWRVNIGEEYYERG